MVRRPHSCRPKLLQLKPQDLGPKQFPTVRRACFSNELNGQHPHDRHLN